MTNPRLKSNMAREDIKEHIKDVLDGEKTVEATLHCNYCGVKLEGNDYVTWDIEPTPAAGIGGGTMYFCDEECKEQHKQDIIHRGRDD